LSEWCDKVDTVLVDLDRQGNLRKLLGEGTYLPAPNKKTEGHRVAVINHDEWDENAHDEGIVICDCNPELDANPQHLIEKFEEEKSDSQQFAQT